MAKKISKKSISELIIREVESQIKKDINKKEYENHLHKIVTDQVKELMK